MTTPKSSNDAFGEIRRRAARLGLYGLLANLDKVADAPWVEELLAFEEAERDRRSLERRLKNAKLGRFKPMADFDWTWPKKIDRELVEEIFQLDFIADAANVILVGQNGVGKTMIAKNLAYQAVLRGHTARFLTASELLNDLAAQESSGALMRRIRHFAYPKILVLDEVGYLATSSEHADLLFEVITRRYEEKPIILTTNKPFPEWNQVFPSSTSVVTLIDRLIHKSEIIKIDADSFRLREARERAKERKDRRSRRSRSK